MPHRHLVASSYAVCAQFIQVLINVAEMGFELLIPLLWNTHSSSIYEACVVHAAQQASVALKKSEFS